MCCSDNIFCKVKRKGQDYEKKSDNVFNLENNFLNKSINDTLNNIFIPNNIINADTTQAPLTEKSFTNINENTAPIIPPPLAAAVLLNIFMS